MCPLTHQDTGLFPLSLFFPKKNCLLTIFSPKTVSYILSKTKTSMFHSNNNVIFFSVSLINVFGLQLVWACNKGELFITQKKMIIRIIPLQLKSKTFYKNYIWTI